ncbi:hypothetical protein LTR37_000447 [Vermiconidia calcicola]|uniref:Uncharacterized protein n=1 Tax=Vermiconidia calcicola TaxID=1690605 RepID=A0ACC3P076_9PEZI|nr:hypothetical protein LTR37_000447 [Vermiconidia calcicola]
MAGGLFSGLFLRDGTSIEDLFETLRVSEARARESEAKAKQQLHRVALENIRLKNELSEIQQLNAKLPGLKNDYEKLTKEHLTLQDRASKYEKAAEENREAKDSLIIRNAALDRKAARVCDAEDVLEKYEDQQMFKIAASAYEMVCEKFGGICGCGAGDLGVAFDDIRSHLEEMPQSVWRKVKKVLQDEREKKEKEEGEEEQGEQEGEERQSSDDSPGRLMEMTDIDEDNQQGI